MYKTAINRVHNKYDHFQHVAIRVINAITVYTADFPDHHVVSTGDNMLYKSWINEYL